jgi:hypothetical protein
MRAPCNTALATAVLGLALGVPLPAQQSATPAVVRLDAAATSIVVTASTALQSDVAFPVARARAARLAAMQAPELLLAFVLELPATSSARLGALAATSPQLMEQLATFATRPRLHVASLDRTLSRLQTEYHYPVFAGAAPSLPAGFALIELFIEHSRPLAPAPVLGFHPTRAFSGVLIYAAGDYPAHGKNGERQLQQALLPKVYDEDLEVVYGSAMVEPDALREWGVVRYAARLDDLSYVSRIGAFPLRIMARGLYGELDTDIIISSAAARTLLADRANARILREGRVVVVVGVGDGE